MPDFLSVELNADAALRAMQQAPARVERATMRALTRGGTAGRAEMARRIAKDMGMKVGDAKEAVLLQPATLKNLSVRLVASTKRRPLFDFQARQTGRGVTFRGVGGTRTLVASAFVATMKTGHQGVFLRKGKPRLPIRELFGVSVGHVFNRHRAAVVTVITATFDKNLASELKFASTENV
jgi:hypothetical protein